MTKTLLEKRLTSWLFSAKKSAALTFTFFLCTCLSLFTARHAHAGGLTQDLNCELNSILGGNCSEIERINQYQEKKQAEWLAGSTTAVDMIRSIVAYHQKLTPIDSYNKELYLYNLQVAQACDSGKISKEQGLYFMTKKENEIQYLQSSKQPPLNRPFTCVTETFGGTTTTKCQ